MDLPILPETYWNPYSKELCVDEILSQVITSPKWTVEESQRATQESWSAFPSLLPFTPHRAARADQLETEGMLTSRILGAPSLSLSWLTALSLCRASHQREDQSLLCLSLLFLL
jgi:hypothetical protein